jgi:hypothetical protein
MLPEFDVVSVRLVEVMPVVLFMGSNGCLKSFDLVLRIGQIGLADLESGVEQCLACDVSRSRSFHHACPPASPPHTCAIAHLYFAC